MNRVPIWKLLVDRGLFPSRDVAERWILSGKVIAGDARVDKPGFLVDAELPIRVKGLERRFVSRGGEKLDHALSVFGVSVEGRVALDCGASTGGFTDCLLKRGAARVYAVDVGFGQLSGRLRADPRVDAMERTNLGDPRLLELDPAPEIVALDLSYLSLRDALPIARAILHGRGAVVALVKPLFEVQDSRIRREGVVPDRSVYSRVLRELVEHCALIECPARAVTYSPIRGSRGTEEYFIAVDLPPGRPAASPDSLERQIEDATTYWESRG